MLPRAQPISVARATLAPSTPLGAASAARFWNRRRELLDVFSVGFFALAVLYAGAAVGVRFGRVPAGRRGVVWSEAQGWAFGVAMGLYGASVLVDGWPSEVLLVAGVLVFCFGLYLIRGMIRQSA